MSDAGLRVDVDINGLTSKLQRIGVALQPPGLLKAIGLRQLKWVDDNFVKSGALIGGWPALSPLTIMFRRGGSSKPLMNTGDLRASFNPGSPGALKVGTMEVTIGTPSPHARIHNEGGTIKPINGKFLVFGSDDNPIFAKSVKIPKRQMLPSVDIARDLAIAIIRARAKIELEKQNDNGV